MGKYRYEVVPNNDAADDRLQRFWTWQGAMAYAADLEDEDDVYEVEINDAGGQRVYHVAEGDE